MTQLMAGSWQLAMSVRMGADPLWRVVATDTCVEYSELVQGCPPPLDWK